MSTQKLMVLNHHQYRTNNITTKTGRRRDITCHLSLLNMACLIEICLHRRIPEDRRLLRRPVTRHIIHHHRLRLLDTNSTIGYHRCTISILLDHLRNNNSSSSSSNSSSNNSNK